jgi:hypothetical protein
MILGLIILLFTRLFNFIVHKLQKMKVIITGVTGMVGEGVLHECLNHNKVDQILLVNRKPCGIQHPKIKEIIHADFYNLSAIENDLKGFDACFFCLGVTSINKKEDEYFRLTHTLTLNFAETLVKQNTGMTFCYISGAGTDSSEKGKVMWARVKGKTENDVFKLPFKKAYAFRPGYLHPTKGLKNTHSFYSFIKFLYPIFYFLIPNQVSTLKQLGFAMINVVLFGYEKQVLEVKDINKLC